MDGAILRSGVTAFVAALAVATPGCGGYHRICATPHLGDPVEADVEVTFLGVGGFLIRYDGLAVMTAPFYSNPTMGEIASQATRSDHRLIDALLPRVVPHEQNVSAILVGHSHYDHLMDVPHVATHHTTTAEIIGNHAMTMLLAPWTSLDDRVVSVEEKAFKLDQLRCEAACPDADRYSHKVGPRIKVWPILSEHSSQFTIPLLDQEWFPAVHVWRGDLSHPLRDPPLRAGEWVEGTTLAYLIDLFDSGGALAFRIYYQDSGARNPLGVPPPCVLAQRPVDLALLCTGGSSTLEHHPTEIVAALRPAFTLAGHWEDFFTPRELPLPAPCCGQELARGEGERFNEVHGAKVKAFARHLRSTLPPDSFYAVPCPDAVTRFRPLGSRWSIRESSEQWTAGKGSVAGLGARGQTCARSE